MFAGFSKLLVTSEENNVLVINLDETQPDLVCDDLPPFPRSTNGVTGQLFHGKTPILCGGYYSTEYLCDCYALTDGSWTSIEPLKTCRHHSSSALLSLQTGGTLDEHMLVIGGSLDSGHTSTVEVFDGKTWRDDVVPERPQEQTQFCTIRINETNIISLGGITGFERGSYFFNSVENKWTEGPDMIEDRNGLSCGILNWFNPDTGAKEQVVVAASGDNRLDSELLFLKNYYESGSGWVQGPSLPGEAFLASMVEFEDSVILVGGSEGVDGFHLYKLDSPFGSWVEMEQTLREPHDRGAAFLVPDELVSCFKASK